jgi:hypothetical protein
MAKSNHVARHSEGTSFPVVAKPYAADSTQASAPQNKRPADAQIMPEAEPIVLTARDWEAFLALDEVDRPRPRLDAAVQRYRDRQLP